MNWLGVASIAFFFSHVAYHVRFGDVGNSLWSCHVACLLIGCGAIFRHSDLAAIGVLWLVIGIPLWFYHLAVGGEFIPTSILTHFGGLAIGLAVLNKLGMPRSVWWRALLGLVVLGALSRCLTSPALNVNLAFFIPGKPTSPATSHAIYLAVLGTVVAVVFFAAEFVLRRYFARPPANQVLTEPEI